LANRKSVHGSVGDQAPQNGMVKTVAVLRHMKAIR